MLTAVGAAGIALGGGGDGHQAHLTPAALFPLVAPGKSLSYLWVVGLPDSLTTTAQRGW